MDIGELAADWAERLCLPHWDIQVKVVPEAAESSWEPGTLCSEHSGECWWNGEHGSAYILVSDKHPNPEQILVHEMLHLRLEGHLPEPLDYNHQYERAINAIADALLEG